MMPIHSKRVGILGGGQLARMLCLEGFKMGLEMHVLSTSPHDPAAQVTKFWHQGDPQNSYDTESFFQKVDVVTCESEFLDERVLLGAEAHASACHFPSPRILNEFSDRLKQKTWLERFQIPTADFAPLSEKNHALSFADCHRGRVVIKKRRFGYDGYGTFILKTRAQLNRWLKVNENELTDYIIEDYVPFRRELAIQLAINHNKEVTVFPLVEWRAEEAKCLWVKGPIQHPKLKPLLKKISEALKRTGYIGLIAFEIFETRKGLTINEVAPRVHNSGHYTIEACVLNQFSAHLRAILNAPLPDLPGLHTKGFAMINLIGRGSSAPQLSWPDKAALHWYGKGENRKGRKMGHLTILDQSPDRALREALKLRKGFPL